MRHLHGPMRAQGVHLGPNPARALFVVVNLTYTEGSAVNVCIFDHFQSFLFFENLSFGSRVPTASPTDLPTGQPWRGYIDGFAT